MPGLTLNTSAGGAGAPVPAPTQAVNQGASASTAAPSTSNPPAAAAASGSSSPTRPTYSPITPPLKPIFPASSSAAGSHQQQQQRLPPLPPLPEALPFPARQQYTHTGQMAQTAQNAVAPPPPEPLDFDSNPDVLALKSAISILQMQRSKAAADMAALDRAKAAALAQPGAFLEDLTTGRVRVEGDRLFVGGVRADEDDDSSDSSSSEEEEEEEEEEKGKEDQKGEDDNKMDTGESGDKPSGQDTDAAPDAASDASSAKTTKKKKPQAAAAAAAAGVKTEGDAMDVDSGAPPPPEAPQQNKPWTSLPKPQNVVRAPPINWAQYAVVGESLDRLHNEQIQRPTPGAPATVTPDGRFEFRAGDAAAAASRPGERLVGVAAPYTPGRDKIDRKGKGPKR